jgi:recombination protein RecT
MNTNNGTALEKKLNGSAAAANPVKTIKDVLESMKGELSNALPKIGITPERIIRLAITEIRRNPKLLTCTQQSLLGSIMQAAQLGLEIGIDGQAYLVPYKNECTFIIGYKGLIELMYRHNRVKKVFGGTIHEGDEVVHSYGSDEQFKHVPALTGRGAVKAYYAYVKLDGDEQVYILMSKEDVVEHAKKFSPSFNSSYNSPWKSDFDSMAIKTCVRQLSKWIPKSSELRDAIMADERVSTYNASADVAEDLVDISASVVVEEEPVTEQK